MLSVFESIWSMSVTASAVIAVVLIARLLLKKAPKLLSYALWSVVLIRLLCPFSFESAISLIPEPVVDTKAPEVSFLVSEIKQDTVPMQGTADYVVSVPLGFPKENLELSDAPGFTLPNDVVRPVQIVPPESPETFRFPVEWVWFSVSAILAIIGAVRYVLLRRKLRFCVPLRENIWLADGIPSAFVIGLLRPRIYLPSTLPEREWSYILAHERCHIRRGDPVIRLLSFAAVCLHWFNPLVWLAFYLAGQDMEMSCDEAVIRTFGEKIRGDYSQSLLNLSTGRSRFAFTPLAFGEGNTGKRIRNLGKWKKPVLWIVVIAVVLCVILAVCLLTNPKQETESDIPELSIPEEINPNSTYGVPAVEWEGRFDEKGHRTDATMKTQVKNLPGTIFIWDEYGRLFVEADGVVTQMHRSSEVGSSVYDVMFADLTGDGIPEVCSAGETGSGFSFKAICVYDITQKQEYVLYHDDYDGVDPSAQNYELVLVDGYLWARESTLEDSGEYTPVAYGPLTLLTEEGTVVPAIIDISDWSQEAGSDILNVTIPEGEFSYPLYGVPAVQWIDTESALTGKTESVEIEQFPGVKFHYNGTVSAENMKTGETEKLYSGMPIQNVFFADLTGDGLPELCSAVYFGSGVIDSHIVVFDYANGREYTLWERMENDYYLKLVDGVLWAEKRDYFSPHEVLCEGPLTLLAQGDTMVPVILDKSDWHYEMSPTTSSMIGGYGGYLFVEINGRNYRFRRQTIDPQGLTADVFLGIYYENTIQSFDSRTCYQVYSTKEYADHTVLLVNEDGHHWASYRYAPAQRISNGTWESIRQTERLVILEDGKATSGQVSFLKFAENAKEGKPCSIQTASYYTLDPSSCVDELYQTVVEDYPRLYLHTLVYDGESFTISWEEDGKQIVRNYKYLMCYTGEPNRADAGYSSYIRFVLTNDNTVIWDDIFNGMISSQFGAYIDHYTVYTEYLP